VFVRLALVNFKTQGHGAEVFVDRQLWAVGFGWFGERVFGFGRKGNKKHSGA
jgi:hypothetical protein